MNDLNEDTGSAGREAIKELRAARRHTIQIVARRVKDQKRAVEAIHRLLLDGGKTVPELAEESGMTPSEVLWFVAALKKYGDITEGEKDGSYFRYEWAGATPE
jgi:hypothetical protein